MAQPVLFAGPTLRRLRRREGLTQAAMAQALGVSASYLNLVERNQRPVTARLLLALTDRFDFDPRALSSQDDVGGVDGLRRRLADERFSDLGIDRDEIVEWLNAAPHGATAFARLYDAAGETTQATGDDDAGLAVRREIERWHNHYADLDHAAEELADELRLSSGELSGALAERLRHKHQLSVRILPADVMPDALRRLDYHARQLQVSEVLQPASRNFQMAVQIALLEQRQAIDALVSGAAFTDRGAVRLYRRHLANYFAAAVLMPYGRLLRACEATAYDFELLERRFGVGFEQLAHRLTTLQRVGQRGLPFFMARLDRAGQFSKRYAGASGTLLLETEASCPLWSAHRAFERAGESLVQVVSLEDARGAEGLWLTVSRTVDGSGAIRPEAARFVVVVGLEARLAGQLACARGKSLEPGSATRIGLGCGRCLRADCQQRSRPPRGAALSLDERSRGLTPFSFASG